MKLLIIIYSDTLGPNQACTLPGSSPGSIFVAGRDYVREGYGLDVADLWRRNFVVVLGFMIFFWITQVIAIEYWPVSLCTESWSNN